MFFVYFAAFMLSGYFFACTIFSFRMRLLCECVYCTWLGKCLLQISRFSSYQSQVWLELFLLLFMNYEYVWCGRVRIMRASACVCALHCTYTIFHWCFYSFHFIQIRTIMLALFIHSYTLLIHSVFVAFFLDANIITHIQFTCVLYSGYPLHNNMLFTTPFCVTV